MGNWIAYLPTYYSWPSWTRPLCSSLFHFFHFQWILFLLLTLWVVSRAGGNSIFIYPRGMPRKRDLPNENNNYVLLFLDQKYWLYIYAPKYIFSWTTIVNCNQNFWILSKMSGFFDVPSGWTSSDIKTSVLYTTNTRLLHDFFFQLRPHLRNPWDTCLRYMRMIIANIHSISVLHLFAIRWGNMWNHKFMMMNPLYWSRMSGPHCNCIDIPTVNTRWPSFHNTIMSFYDS